MNTSVNWIIKKFDELTLHELYAILRLRNEVFVVEQNCVYQDTDDKDKYCIHLMGWQADLLAAYTRIVPPGISYEFPSIGRVVTSPKRRKGGLGRELMEKSIEAVKNLFGETPVVISAQLYLKMFYESLGFEQSGDVYREDGIEHIKMIKT